MSDRADGERTPGTDSLAERAAEWFMANRDGLDPEQRAQFTTWLRQSPAHVEAYLRIVETAVRLATMPHPTLSQEELLEQSRAAASVQPVRPRARDDVRPSRRPAWFYAAAAAVGVIALSYLWFGARAPQPTATAATGERFTTAHGEQLTRLLADGSTLHLNTDTAVEIRFDRAVRRVDVERGQAVFEVAHDAARPFRVLAGSAVIVAVGTRFDVYLQAGATLVTVLEGQVAVSAAPTLSAPGQPASAPLSVPAGEMVRVVDGHVPDSPSPVDPGRRTAWLERQMLFDNTPLEDAVAEVNRYAPVPIEIETPALRQQRISGKYSIDDTKSFVDLLRSLDGVRVEVTPTRIRVSQK